MVLATFVMIMLFIFYSFRSPKWSLISLIPLLVGFSWLFGLMLLFGLKFNFYNLVVIPAILGIGCDNGVHLAHRFREEGVQASREVLKSTGQHISIGSLTTMLGFAGLLFTQHPGLQSIGVMAVLGIGMTLLSALVLLPSVLQILEKIAGRRSHTEILP
jgi:predicted RND superfamily exporter protein